MRKLRFEIVTFSLPWLTIQAINSIYHISYVFIWRCIEESFIDFLQLKFIRSFFKETFQMTHSSLLFVLCPREREHQRGWPGSFLLSYTYNWGGKFGNAGLSSRIDSVYISFLLWETVSVIRTEKTFIYCVMKNILVYSF